MVAIGSPGRMSMWASTAVEACESRCELRRARAVAARADDFSAARRVIFMTRPRYQIGRKLRTRPRRLEPPTKSWLRRIYWQYARIANRQTQSAPMECQYQETVDRKSVV